MAVGRIVSRLVDFNEKIFKELINLIFESLILQKLFNYMKTWTISFSSTQKKVAKITGFEDIGSKGIQGVEGGSAPT